MDYAEKRMAFGSPITKLQAVQVQAGHMEQFHRVLGLVESLCMLSGVVLGTQCTLYCLG